MFQQKVNSGTGDRIINISQQDTVMPEKTYRVTVERIGSATGTVTVSGRYLLCDTYNALLDENGNAVGPINLASLTEPKHFYFYGDIADVKFTPASLVGNYNAIVTGW